MTDMPITDDDLTVAQAAEILGVSVRWVRKICSEGRLGKRFGHGYIIGRAELTAFQRQVRGRPRGPEMKLWQVDQSDCEYYAFELIVAETDSEAIDRFMKMHPEATTGECSAAEVAEVDGYRIILRRKRGGE